MLLATFLLTILTTVISAQQCYTPDGSFASDVPCNNSTPFSACCPSTGYCLSNGLCIDNGILSRGSCTDKTWKSGSCAQYCQDSDPSGGYALMSCTNSTFTCGFYPDNCAVSSDLFTIEDAGSIVLRDYQLTSAMLAAGVNDGPVASTCASATATATAHSTSGSAANPNGKQYSATDMAILGVLLVVVFLAIIGGLVFLLLRERKQRVRVQKQIERDGHMLLQQQVYSPQQPQPAYNYYAAPDFPQYNQNSPFVAHDGLSMGYGPPSGGGVELRQSSLRAELGTVVASELDSEYKRQSH